MIGIIGAQIEEIKAFIEEMTEVKETTYQEITFYVGKLADKEVVLALCGIGKVAAARITTLLIDHFDVSVIINVGTAGGVNGAVQKRDVVMAKQLAYSDADVTFFNYKYGQMAKCPRYFETDESEISKVIKTNEKIVLGCILSGDQFVNDEEKAQLIIKLFENVKVCAIDMESTAVAQTCYLMKKKFIVLRYISDIIGESNQEDNYEANLLISSNHLVGIVKKYLSIGD